MAAALRAIGEDMTEEETTQVETATDDTNDLSDAFNDEEVTTETETETTETETTETETEKGAETKETEKSETKATETEVTPTSETIGLQAALVAERHKRQEAERKLKETEVPETVPDPIEDPKGYSDHIEAKADKNLLSTKIDLSRDIMMDSKDDYLEKEKVFMGLVGSDVDGEFVIADESLFQRFKASKNPGKFAYETAVTHLDIEAKSAPDYVEKLLAKEKEKWLAELQEAGKVSEGLKVTDVPDLTGASAGSNATEIEKVEDLLNTAVSFLND